MIGARMKTPWTGVLPRTGTSSSDSNESSWRPNALRSTVTSRSGRIGASPPAISVASTIIPAHVPKIGAPRSARSRIGPWRPQRSMSWRIVVLSPPGRISPLTPARSAGSRTRTPSTPMAWSVSRCSRNAPCRARTPILMSRSPCWSSVLPAPDREALLVGDGLERDAAHRRAEPLGDLRDLLRVVEEGRRLDDRVRHPGRILAFEDARSDEDAFSAELHHQRRIGRCADPAGHEVDDRQLSCRGDLLDQLVRRAQFLGRHEQLVLAQSLEATHLSQHVAQLTDGLDDVAGPGLALGPHHRRALVDPAQC